MSEDTLFSEATKKSISPFTIIFVVGAILVVVGVYVFNRYASYVPPIPAEQIAEAKTRDAVVMLLAFPQFSGESFRQQILGEVRVQKLMFRDREVYFSAPESGEQEFADAIDKFVIDRQKLVFAETKGEKFDLDGFMLRKTPETGYFFKTKLENLRFDPNVELQFPYKNLTYTLSMSELVGFAENKQVYGGKIMATTDPRIDNKAIMFGNHGALVARPDEPSLKRLVAQLLGDAPENLSREVKIQKLLDFVTTEIEYDFYEALGTSETLKRPNEVLMTRRSDCSNKTILMASLLEQIGEDYLLLYCPNHITVAVPQGAFSLENRLKFEWDSQIWIAAETTMPQFQIGKTKIAQTKILNKVLYVQKPKQAEIIFEASTLRPLDFKYY